MDRIAAPRTPLVERLVRPVTVTCYSYLGVFRVLKRKSSNFPWFMCYIQNFLSIPLLHERACALVQNENADHHAATC